MNFQQLLKLGVGLLTALLNSPAIIAWFNGLGGGNLPTGTLPEVDPNDPALEAAFNESPKMKAWIEEHGHHVALPDGVEAVNVAPFQIFLQFLPQILTLLSGLFNKQPKAGG